MGRGLLISRNVGRAAAPALTLADTRSPALPLIGPQTSPGCPLWENNPPWWTWGMFPPKSLKQSRFLRDFQHLFACRCVLEELLGS